MTTNGRRSRLAWPVRNAWGQTVWLSSGQRALLFYVMGRIGYGRGNVFKRVELARAAGIHESNVTRGLDRLATLGVIGRKSTRGCLGETRIWRLTPRTSRALRLRANGATSTPFGGYLTRERWETEARNGSDRVVRRLTPPWMLYGRCAAGHRVRLTRLSYRRWPARDRHELRTFEGTWAGRCRRCPPGDSPVYVPVGPVTVAAGAAGHSWERAGVVAGRVVGGSST